MPDVAERWSPLVGAPFLAVDLRAGRVAAAGEEGERALAALASLPCPTIGLVTSADATDLADAANDRFRAALDLLAESERDLEALASAIRAAPIAAMTLVQVMRLGARIGVIDALLLESLAYGTLLVGPEHRRWLVTRGRRPPFVVNAEPAVLVSRSDVRLDLVLNRPEKRNAYSAEMRDALVAGLELALADPSLVEVVLTGRGTTFSAGGDLDEFGSHPDVATAHAIRSTRSAARLAARCGERLRAEVHGAAIGAGIELAAFARTVVAKPDAFFQLPELAMGLIPGAGGTASIPRRIGRQRATWMALSGARVDAPTALRWGLIDAIQG
ncbi:MAG: enoyl-CoA hydratase/isomerase family protein [Deltaproteobacteria bacterium]|nr:enoyl-CoA hydratase/isomerase family protein [Deltaproteobacteria bacterium]